MTVSKIANLILIPAPGMGHLVPAIELVEQLVVREPRISISVLLIQGPFYEETVESYVKSLKSNCLLANRGIEFIDVPRMDLASFGFKSFASYLEPYRPKVKDLVQDLQSRSTAPVAGLLLDMFCATMVDVASEIGLPSYVFFPSNASLLCLFFHFQELGMEEGREYDVVGSPDTTVEILGFRNPVPIKNLPRKILSKDTEEATLFMRLAAKYRQTKGILVNTFVEIEECPFASMLQDKNIPPVYPVGPLLNLSSEDDDPSIEKDPTMRWLDDQPPQSVVFLCFGSRGSFNETQIKEIAIGLERSGQRFLWSLRQKPDTAQVPSEIDDPSKVLPEGFLERTSKQGKVIGWAPQARVLSHKATGAFVSHCGWNSTMESFWYGVPIAVWPIYAEQQLNAFVLVKELGLAAEIKIDYRQDFGIDMVVKADEVANGIKKVMEETMLRKKVKEMRDKARMALEDGGSSNESLCRFIESVFENLP